MRMFAQCAEEPLCLRPEGTVVEQKGPVPALVVSVCLANQPWALGSPLAS